MLKNLLITILMLNFGLDAKNFNSSKTDRNQYRLVKLINTELGRIKNRYISEFTQLTLADHTCLSNTILTCTKKTYWFYAFSRYHNQILSDKRVLKILTNKLANFLTRNAVNNLELDHAYMDINTVQSQLTQLENYLLHDPNFIQAKNKYTNWCNLKWSTIVTTIVIAVCLVPVIIFCSAMFTMMPSFMSLGNSILVGSTIIALPMLLGTVLYHDAMHSGESSILSINF